MTRAFGKIILAGEHAVVYGYPAIAMTIDLEVRIIARLSSRPGLNFARPKIDPEHKSASLFVEVLPKLIELLGSRIKQLEFQIDSDIPGGCGLGSSAALSVGLIRAALDFFDESRSAQEIARMALELEKIFHGNPSGVDHTVIAEEGLIWFERGKAQKIISQKPLNLSIKMASPHAGTLAAVQAVRRRYEQDKAGTTQIFEAISELTYSMRRAIEQGELPEVGRLMTQNHELLNKLGVSTNELDLLCADALEQGALGAKLTGAGGGGCIIALYEN
ncbi:MAG: mevalonate kinase [Myxococcaceae bacterium]